MASFVGRLPDRTRVRVNLHADVPQVVARAEVLAEGWPTLDGDLWTWDGLAVRPEVQVRRHDLDWSEVDGVRNEGAPLVIDKAVARLGEALMLFPVATRVRSGVRRLSGWTTDGGQVEWLVAGDFGGCGCSGR